MESAENAGMKLAIYARVSTEEQREGQTIDSQISELERFTRDKAWVVTGVYKEEGWSGGLLARPQLDHLRDDAKAGKFAAVLINDVDRLARDVSHLGIIKRDLEKQGVKVIFRKLPSDQSPTYNLMVNVLGSFAEFERELIADRTRRGRRFKVEVRKEYFSSRTAFGYRYIPMDKVNRRPGRLEVNASEADTVRKMFEWVDADGLSARGVIDRLNQLGIRPQYGRKWGRSTVLRMLHNEMYAGVWHYNKLQGCEPTKPQSPAKYRRQMKTSRRQRPREEWLPIELPRQLILVSHDRWQRVQTRLQRNRCLNPGNARHFYLLQGLVRCGSCGARYTGDPSHGEFRYRCYGRCHQVPTIREAVLNRAVRAATEQLIQNPSVVLDQIERLRQVDPETQAVRKRQIEETETELARLGTEESRLLEAYRSEIINAVQLGKELEKLRARRGAAEQRQTDMAKLKPPVEIGPIKESVEYFCRDVKERFHALPQEQLREFLRTVIREIIFDGQQIRIRGHLPVYAPQGAASTTTNIAPIDVTSTLHLPAAINAGGQHEFTEAQKEIVRQGRSQRGRQEVGRVGRRNRLGSCGRTGVNPDTRSVPTAQAQEVTKTGVSWTMTLPVKPSRSYGSKSPASCN